MFKLCLFDLDETLIRTEDLKDLREACKNNSDPTHLKKLSAGLAAGDDRHIYSLEELKAIRGAFPKLKLGIFTRSPRSYANTVLKWAYPGFGWDVVVAYEDVKQTKPYGDGIDKAMNDLGIEYIDEVLLVGDSDVDIRAAYHCGCVAALDKRAWPGHKATTHWQALELVPDATIGSHEELLDFLKDSAQFLPELERIIDGNSPRYGGPRFDRIGHFIPPAAGGDKTAYQISVSGRSFSKHKAVQYRRQWHKLTKSIEENKDVDTFPDSWVETVRAFIENQCRAFFRPVSVVVCVVPHRPGRKARLEKFLCQFAASIAANPIPRRNISIEPQLLAYKDGVKSQHNDLLGREERFMNVRDHLFVQKPELVDDSTIYVVIDDVTTTGASLIYAFKYLQDAGADEVKCLSLAKNVGKIVA